MWKLGFLLTTWLVHNLADADKDSFSSTNTYHSDIGAEFDKIAEDYLSTITLAHTKVPSRKRRELLDTTLLADDKGVYRFKGLSPVSRLCYPAVYSKFLTVENVTYAICAQKELNNEAASILFGVYWNHRWDVKHRWFAGTPNEIAAFSFNEYIYVLVADSDRVDGTDLVSINIYTGEKKVDHVVHSRSAKRISIWKMKNDGNYHMAIANSASHHDDFGSEVYVYEWRGTYFDRYDAFPAYDVMDMQPFHIHDTAFLAVANNRKDRNGAPVDSEVLKYNLGKNKWVSHQKIRTYGAMDWEFFTLGENISQEFFLVVSNKDAKKMTPVIYKFVKDQFVPFQCLPVPGATSSAAWSYENAFLLAVSNFDGVYLFQYDGWQFVESKTQYTHNSLGRGELKHLVFYVIYNSSATVILSVSNCQHFPDDSVYEVEFEYENPLGRWYDDSTKWCLNTLESLKKTNIDPDGLFDDVVFIDQPTPIVIDGDLIFEKGFESDTVITPQLTNIITQETYDGSMLEDLQKLQNRLEAVRSKMRNFDEVLENALHLHGNQTITGHLKFNDVRFNCEEYPCQFKSINTTMLNGEEIGDWSKNLVFLDGEQVIHGTLQAEEIIADSITVEGFIDGVDSKALVTKSGDHTIVETKTFVNPVTAREVEVHGLVDGVKISRDNILLTTGLQNITGDIKFDNVETSWLEVLGTVNGRDLRAFYEDVVRSDSETTITGEKIFHDVVVDDLIMNPGATINGVDFADLWENALWKEGHQEVLAPMTFKSMSVGKNLQAQMGINDIQIPGPRVVNINEPAYITAPQTFTNLTKIANLNVLKSLNGLQTIDHDHGPTLDIMLKTGAQVVTGKKTFSTIHLDADSTVTGKVNGINLSELKDIALRRSSSLDTNRTWVFNNLEIKGPVSVNTISGHKLEDIYERALKLTDRVIPEITFKDVVYIEELESHSINGVDVENDLVLKSRPQNLTGKKIFEEIILEENSVVVDTINNVNISFLNDTILRIGNQALKSKQLHGNVKMNKLTVLGSINNIPIGDFVTLNEEQYLHSRELVNVSFHEIEATNIQVAGKVNTIDIDQMMKNTMTIDGNQNVTGVKTIKGAIHVIENEDLSVNYINGIDIPYLFEDAVYVDGFQNISGLKTFEAPVTFNNLIFSTIDGVSRYDMENWMLRDKYQVVSGNTVFDKPVTIKNLKVNGLINSINVTELDESVVKLNEPNVIEGPIYFGEVISNGPITVAGTVQGIKLSEEVVTTPDVFITGKKTFTEDLTVLGDVNVRGLVDGVSVEQLCQTSLLIHEENITHLTIKGDVVLLGGATIEGTVAGVDLMKLRDIAISTEDKELTFTGQKKFENLTIEGHVTLEGYLGGVDLQDLANNYMSLTREQVITGKMQFDTLIIKGTLSANEFESSNRMVNGIDVGRLNYVLRKDNLQNITAEHHFNEVVFENDVFVVGKVNGIEVPNGLMRRNHPNYIQTPKIFEKPVRVQGDLVVEDGRKIQGVDVSEWSKKAVLKEGGPYFISGDKTFHNLSIIDAKVEGLLDGLNISKETLLMTYGDQVVTGTKTIKGDVTIKGNMMVNGHINGIDLEYLSRNTLQRDRSNVVTGSKTFTKTLTVRNLMAPTVAGVDVIELSNKINRDLDFSVLESRLQEIGEVVDKMKESISKQAILLQYYEIFQEFTSPTVYNSLYVPGALNEYFLISDNSSSIPGCTIVQVFHVNDYNGFTLHQELIAAHAVSVEMLNILDSTFVFVANQIPNVKCSNGKFIGQGNTTVDIYTLIDGFFVESQVLETPPLHHMLAFQDSRLSCLVCFESHYSKLYCSGGQGSEFQFHETLPSTGGRKASVIVFSHRIILAVISEDKMGRIEYEKPVEIYFWDEEKSTFGHPFQVILSTYVQSALLMSYTRENIDHLFLVIAEGQIPKVRNKPKLLVYRFDEELAAFVKYQEIDDYGELQFIVLQTGELILFVLDAHLGKLKLYQHKGVSGFVPIDTVNTIGSVSVRPFIRVGDPVNHYLALSGPRVAMAQPYQGTDYAKILKSKIKGIRHFIE